MEDKQIARIDNPFQAPAAQAGASVAIEGMRVATEVMAAMEIARRYPRDPSKAMDAIIDDCCQTELAEDASYEYARGGSNIDGPSIRLAETIARRWGNMECGVKEIGRRDGYSEVQAYAIDLQTGFRDVKTFQVKHWRDTKRGGYAVTDERDIYELVANSGARRKRACILALIPPEVVNGALRQCSITLSSKIEINEDYLKKVLTAFEAFGVTKEMLEKRIQRKFEALTPTLALQLRRIHNSLRDNMSSPAEWFDVQKEVAPGAPDDLTAAMRAKAGKTSPPEKKEPPKEPSPERNEPAEAKPDAAPQAKPGLPSLAELEKKVEVATTAQEISDLLAPISAHPESPERAKVSKAWMEKSRTITQKAKKHGTDLVRDRIIAAMNKAKTEAALDEAYDEVNMYGWDEADKKALADRYKQCKEDLAL